MGFFDALANMFKPNPQQPLPGWEVPQQQGMREALTNAAVRTNYPTLQDEIAEVMRIGNTFSRSNSGQQAAPPEVLGRLANLFKIDPQLPDGMYGPLANAGARTNYPTMQDEMAEVMRIGNQFSRADDGRFALQNPLPGWEVPQQQAAPPEPRIQDPGLEYALGASTPFPEGGVLPGPATANANIAPAPGIPPLEGDGVLPQEEVPLQGGEVNLDSLRQMFDVGNQFDVNVPNARIEEQPQVAQAPQAPLIPGVVNMPGGGTIDLRGMPPAQMGALLNQALQVKRLMPQKPTEMENLNLEHKRMTIDAMKRKMESPDEKDKLTRSNSYEIVDEATGKISRIPLNEQPPEGSMHRDRYQALKKAEAIVKEQEDAEYDYLIKGTNEKGTVFPTFADRLPGAKLWNQRHPERQIEIDEKEETFTAMPETKTKAFAEADGTEQNPFTPSSPEEAAKLPPGSVFINPETGQPMTRN